MSEAERFWKKGYAVIENCLDPSQLAFARAAMEAAARAQELEVHDGLRPHKGQHRNAEDQYSPVAAELLLRALKPSFEALIASPLKETYAFWRIYHHGGLLFKHVDRAACEISATVAIASEPDGILWPIHVEDLAGRTTGIELRPGAAMLYQGHKIPHWRDEFTGTRQSQLFLHYVLRDGEFAGLEFDGYGADPLNRSPVS